ncbi:MAG: ribosome assembly RNA-binding protein YhbY [candidate division KSB1 bacterium]|nr:ribosome assembly RNA-binding protein YhbY [candidate division KSB1 bacterium]
MAGDTLTGKQRRFLRGLGNSLKPIVFVGQQGVTDAVIEAIEMAFNAHELVKIKLQQNVLEDRQAVAEQLARATRSHLVQVLGRTILLFRRHAEKPKIELP